MEDHTPVDVKLCCIWGHDDALMRFRIWWGSVASIRIGLSFEIEGWSSMSWGWIDQEELIKFCRALYSPMVPGSRGLIFECDDRDWRFEVAPPIHPDAAIPVALRFERMAVVCEDFRRVGEARISDCWVQPGALQRFGSTLLETVQELGDIYG